MATNTWFGVWVLGTAVVSGGCGDPGGTGSGTGSTSTSGTLSTGETPTTGNSTPGGSSTSTGDSGSGASDTGGMMTEVGTGVIMTSGSPGSSSGAPVPFCGDGNLDPLEECDEGAANSDNGTCTLACKSAVCGDGLVQTGVEECDDGNADDMDGNGNCGSNSLFYVS